VRRFVAVHIHSAEQLEVLLLLRARVDETWTAATVARELRIQPDSAANRLEDLHARDLLAREEGGTYRYAPQGGARAAVDELADCYSRRKVSVISLIYSKPSDQVMTFADAFKFRRKKD